MANKSIYDQFVFTFEIEGLYDLAELKDLCNDFGFGGVIYNDDQNTRLIIIGQTRKVAESLMNVTNGKNLRTLDNYTFCLMFSACYCLERGSFIWL